MLTRRENLSPHGLEIQERDIALLGGLFEARVMTLHHIATFHFGGRLAAASKRVQKLKTAGLIAERPRKPYEPSILHLSTTAFDLLRERGVLADYPQMARSAIQRRSRVSPLTLDHELAVLNVRAAMWKAISTIRRLRIDEFGTWPLLYRFRASPAPGASDVGMAPDAFIKIIETMHRGDESEHLFFLELDRSTETLETVVQKAHCYADHYRRGGMAARFGRPRSEFKEFPFRVLVICQSMERRDNLALRLLFGNRPILTQVWLTTLKEVLAAPLGEVWVQPTDYQAMFPLSDRATGLDPSHTYRRDCDRQRRIEQNIRRHAMIAGLP
jgi:Replication-relaxation